MPAAWELLLLRKGQLEGCRSMRWCGGAVGGCCTAGGMVAGAGVPPGPVSLLVWGHDSCDELAPVVRPVSIPLAPPGQVR